MGALEIARLWRVAFAASALLAVVMASLPQPPELPGQPSDKLLHIIAFATLTLMARLAYPRAKIWPIFIGLGALGAGIEFIQAIPALGRDASLTDWLADVLAISAVLGVIAAFRWIGDLKAVRPSIENDPPTQS